MKLKHLFLASLAVCAFASCSDDSSNGIDIPEENYQMIDANISLTVTALDGIKTKAAGDEDTEDGSNNEQFINELTAYLFYADGTDENAYKFAAMKTVPSTGGVSVTTVEDIVVKVKATAAGEFSDTKLAAVFFANTKPATTPATLGDVIGADIAGKLVSFSEVHSASGTKYIPMFSQIITIGGGTENGKKLLAGTDYDNWVTEVASPTVAYTKNTTIGAGHTIVKYSESGWEEKDLYDPNNTPDADKIPLTRHVARVQLEGLDCNFTQNYAKATFTLTDVYVANVSTSSKLYGATTAYSLESAAGPFSHGCTYKRDDYFLVKGEINVSSLAKSFTGVSIDMTKNPHSGNMTAGGEVNYDSDKWMKFHDQTTGTNSGQEEMAQFYVYEYNGITHAMTPDKDTESEPSGNIQTMLILKGNWTNKGLTKENRYYRIPIAEGGSVGVKRNTIYKVYATITGEGSKDPDTSELNACISFSIKVQPWKVIKQYEDDVN